MKKSIGPKTLIQPHPVLVIGSYDKEGRPNIMTAAWGGICCSSPPCVAISLRAATHTYSNIMASQAYTVNIPSIDRVKEADYAGIYSGKTENKFESLGLTPVKSELVNAPYVKEFPFVLECQVLQTIEIGLHTQFIGEIKDVKADEDVLGENGLPDIEKVKPFLFDSSSRGYYAFGDLVANAFSVGRKE